MTIISKNPNHTFQVTACELLPWNFLQMSVFWVVAACSLAEAYRRFYYQSCDYGGSKHLCNLGTYRQENLKSHKKIFLCNFIVFPCSDVFSYIGFGAHSTCYQVCTGRSYFGDKRDGTWSWPLTSISAEIKNERTASYVFFAWYFMSIRDKFIFTYNKNNYLNVTNGSEDLSLRMKTDRLGHKLKICAVRVFGIVKRSPLSCGCRTSSVFYTVPYEYLCVSHYVGQMTTELRGRHSNDCTSSVFGP